jgi:hypothetical protein
VVALIKGEITMTLIEKLHANLPHLKNKIRMSRMCTSVLVAVSYEATRSALIADSDEDGMYFICTFDCDPRKLDLLAFDGPHQTEDFKIYSWFGLVQWVEAFLKDASVDELCAIEQKACAHRQDLKGFYIPYHLRGWNDITA